MWNPKEDLSVPVFVIESRVDEKVTIREVLKTLGFSEVILFSSIQEAFFSFEPRRAPRWILTAPFLQDKASVFYLLNDCLKHPERRQTRISLLLDGEERYCLPKALEMGLLSWHLKPYTKQELEISLKGLLARLQNEHYNDALTAAEYVRVCDSVLVDDLIRCDEKLALLHPDRPDLFLRLAESQLQAKKPQDAEKTLSKAKFLDPSIGKAAQQLLDTIEPGKESLSFAKTFGIQNCLIVDPDETVCQFLKSTLEELGAKNVETFTDGLAAWQHINDGKTPDLILTEWKIPKLNGLSLVQRIRGKELHQIPIIVISSLVTARDMPILKEMTIAAHMEKPVTKDSLTKTITNTIQQDQYPSDAKALERKIKQALTEKDMPTAALLKAQFTDIEDVPQAAKVAIEAEYAFAEEKWDAAKKLVAEAIKLSGDSLHLISLLGRIMLKQKNYADALKCFSKTNEYSSQNIERLCAMAESNLQLGNEDEAEDALDKALQIDPENPIVIETQAKVALQTGDTETAKQAFAAMESFTDMIAFTNNKAVSLAMNGQGKEAREIYERLLTALPENAEDHAELLSIIYFNAGMGEIRQGNMKSALEKLSVAASHPSSRIADKVAALKTRVQKAVETGVVVTLNPPPKAATPEPAAKSAPGTQHNPGECCCYQVYYHTGPIDDRLVPALDFG